MKNQWKKAGTLSRAALGAGLLLALTAGTVQPALAAGSAATAAQTKITAEVDGQTALWQDKAYLYRSLTYVPVREGAVSLGGAVKWDKKLGAATVTMNGDEIVYRPGTDIVSVNGFELKMPGATRNVAGVLTVPLRGFTEPFKANIKLSKSADGIRLALTTDSDTQIGTGLEDVDDYLKKEHFSGSVLVAKDGEVLMRKAYGLASDTTLVRPTQKMRLGSLTKAFTAASILKLQEDGKLSVDDTLAQHIPDYPRGDEITLAMLLSHTSGIALNFPRVEGTPLSETVKEIEASKLKFVPGTDYMYSNSGYVLLAYIVEQTSGMSYADFVQSRILDPLGMENSGTATRQTPTPTSYAYDLQSLTWSKVGYYFSPAGTGSLYSTLDDMLTWAQGLSAGKVLSEETMERMYTPTPYKNYGFGWMTEGEGADKVVFHNGGGDGYTTGIRRGLGDGTVVVLLGNLGGLDTNAMTAKIRELAF
ncbi:serine hydrolase [Saccharibacillus sp. CPCC 101409]|uniref:serine hydrolase n=1 Tax=Saccharibacillus sp. CPCC 101409 TaxID=3058041 RepID=UPI00267108A2|nr:serine hydrolase [Saccharibacillus sp. CPCC 101409]MDO3409491.1 serine hydrolase [Saccharibacillus sp. CPCC 101409]